MVMRRRRRRRRMVQILKAQCSDNDAVGMTPQETPDIHSVTYFVRVIHLSNCIPTSLCVLREVSTKFDDRCGVLQEARLYSELLVRGQF
jgi:hypothetical protein